MMTNNNNNSLVCSSNSPSVYRMSRATAGGRSRWPIPSWTSSSPHSYCESRGRRHSDHSDRQWCLTCSWRESGDAGNSSEPARGKRRRRQKTSIAENARVKRLASPIQRLGPGVHCTPVKMHFIHILKRVGTNHEHAAYCNHEHSGIRVSRLFFIAKKLSHSQRNHRDQCFVGSGCHCRSIRNPSCMGSLVYCNSSSSHHECDGPFRSHG